jgi:1,4-alpha-glucan branching enzyme
MPTDQLANWGAIFRALVAVPLLVSCAMAARPESVEPAEFRLKAPQAKQVSVVGTFNSWDPNAHRLQGPDRDGVWTLSVPLAAGRYRYMFVVDGLRWMADPNAVASQNDGFGGRNSLLFHGR